jgi:hypothetical protein|tara:strand:- start:130 stop:639 length:510 start_codon:yes stop_codon:yes gene_type:complete
MSDNTKRLLGAMSVGGIQQIRAIIGGGELEDPLYKNKPKGRDRFHNTGWLDGYRTTVSLSDAFESIEANSAFLDEAESLGAIERVDRGHGKNGAIQPAGVVWNPGRKRHGYRTDADRAREVRAASSFRFLEDIKNEATAVMLSLQEAERDRVIQATALKKKAKTRGVRA